MLSLSVVVRNRKKTRKRSVLWCVLLLVLFQYNPQLLPMWLEKGNISYMHSNCLDNSHYKKVINTEGLVKPCLNVCIARLCTGLCTLSAIKLVYKLGYAVRYHMWALHVNFLSRNIVTSFFTSQKMLSRAYSLVSFEM